MNITWFIIRGSGIAAFGLLSLSVVWGLLVSTRALGGVVKAKGLTWIHEAFGLGALLATIVHLVGVRTDEYIEFTWADVLVPGYSGWEPIPTALGVVSFWIIVLATLSFYVKKWFGPVLWKVVHRLSIGAFAGALVHAVWSGTDATNLWIVGGYAAAFTGVCVFTVTRMLAARRINSAARAGSAAS